MADEIEKYLADLGQRTVNKIAGNLDKKNKNASGNLRQSITYKVFRDGDTLKFQLLAAEYYEEVDKGRRKTTKKGTGGKPLKQAIYEWIVQKGLPVGQLTRAGAARKFGGRTRLRGLIEKQRRGMAYVIARKIHKQGYKGSGFYSEVVNAELLKQVEKEIALLFRAQVIAQLDNIDGNNDTA